MNFLPLIDNLFNMPYLKMIIVQINVQKCLLVYGKKYKNKMKISFILFLSFCLLSCTVPENMEGPISNTGPILSNGNNSNATSNNLVGQTWRINHYRVGDLGQMIATSDILQFTSNTSYKFNGNTSTYSLTITGSGYNLTLNEKHSGVISAVPF